MKRFLIQELVKPASRRLGSIVAGALVTLAATKAPEYQAQVEIVAEQLKLLIPAAIAFGADLALSHRGRN